MKKKSKQLGGLTFVGFSLSLIEIIIIFLSEDKYCLKY